MGETSDNVMGEISDNVMGEIWGMGSNVMGSKSSHRVTVDIQWRVQQSAEPQFHVDRTVNNQEDQGGISRGRGPRRGSAIHEEDQQHRRIRRRRGQHSRQGRQQPASTSTAASVDIDSQRRHRLQGRCPRLSKGDDQGEIHSGARAGASTLTAGGGRHLAGGRSVDIDYFDISSFDGNFGGSCDQLRTASTGSFTWTSCAPTTHYLDLPTSALSPTAWTSYASSTVPLTLASLWDLIASTSPRCPYNAASTSTSTTWPPELLHRPNSMRQKRRRSPIEQGTWRNGEGMGGDGSRDGEGSENSEAVGGRVEASHVQVRAGEGGRDDVNVQRAGEGLDAWRRQVGKGSGSGDEGV
ncbi:hypothetical protein KC19_VG278900, partial [Ceratodon purpureus]